MVFAALNTLTAHLVTSDSSFIDLGLQIPKNKKFEAFGTSPASQSEVIPDSRHVDTPSEIDPRNTPFSPETRATGVYLFIGTSRVCGYQNNSFCVNAVCFEGSKVKSQILKLENRDFFQICFSFLV